MIRALLRRWQRRRQAPLGVRCGASVPPSISQNISIKGPGAGSLTVSGNNSFGIFTINARATVGMSGSTIAHDSASAGGIDVHRANVGRLGCGALHGATLVNPLNFENVT